MDGIPEFPQDEFNELKGRVERSKEIYTTIDKENKKIARQLHNTISKYFELANTSEFKWNDYYIQMSYDHFYDSEFGDEEPSEKEWKKHQNFRITKYETAQEALEVFSVKRKRRKKKFASRERQIPRVLLQLSYNYIHLNENFGKEILFLAVVFEKFKEKIREDIENVENQAELSMEQHDKTKAFIELLDWLN